MMRSQPNYVQVLLLYYLLLILLLCFFLLFFQLFILGLVMANKNVNFLRLLLLLLLILLCLLLILLFFVVVNVVLVALLVVNDHIVFSRDNKCYYEAPKGCSSDMECRTIFLIHLIIEIHMFVPKTKLILSDIRKLRNIFSIIQVVSS